MARDDQVRDLLRRLTPQPEVTIDMEEVRMGARRRSSRAILAAAAAIVVVAAGVAAATTLLRDTSAQGPVTPAPSTEGPPEDCPEPMPGVEVDTGAIPDFVFVGDRLFEPLAGPGETDLGGEFARVTCTIADRSPEYDISAYAFWHEGNAGILPLGTPLRAVPGHDPRCRIGAVLDGETLLYATALEAAGDCRPEAGTGCPESRLMPEGTFSLEFSAAYVMFGGRIYEPLDAGRGGVQLRVQVGLVTCDVIALTAEDFTVGLGHDREITGPAPSGGAHGLAHGTLPVGAQLFAVADYPVQCRIAAVVDGAIVGEYSVGTCG